MKKAKKELRFKIGSTEIGSRPDANIIWYWNSCNADKGKPEIQLMSTEEAKVKYAFMQAQKHGSGHYDIKLYIALATWDKANQCWEIIDSEDINEWQIINGAK